jgi:hypothetical protein
VKCLEQCAAFNMPYSMTKLLDLVQAFVKRHAIKTRLVITYYLGTYLLTYLLSVPTYLFGTVT